MKFVTISRQDTFSNEIMESITEKLINSGFTFDKKNPEIIISIGGDGTLLHAVQEYKSMLSRVGFVGIHTGNLGFYADWRADELDLLVERVTSKAFSVDEYPILRAKINFCDESKKPHKYIALNEMTVRSNGPIVVFDVVIDNKHFEWFRGDGLCFSTPSGSTAYNKSMGGAVIHPSIPAMQMTEIASINNRVYRSVGSSIVLPLNQKCVLKTEADHMLRISVDYLNLKYKDVSSISFSLSKQVVRFLRYREFPFWERIRESFIK